MTLICNMDDHLDERVSDTIYTKFSKAFDKVDHSILIFIYLLLLLITPSLYKNYRFSVRLETLSYGLTPI